MPTIKEQIETFQKETRVALQHLLLHLGDDTTLSVREWNGVSGKLQELQRHLEKLEPATAYDPNRR